MGKSRKKFRFVEGVSYKIYTKDGSYGVVLYHGDNTRQIIKDWAAEKGGIRSIEIYRRPWG